MDICNKCLSTSWGISFGPKLCTNQHYCAYFMVQVWLKSLIITGMWPECVQYNHIQYACIWILYMTLLKLLIHPVDWLKNLFFLVKYFIQMPCTCITFTLTCVEYNWIVKLLIFSSSRIYKELNLVSKTFTKHCFILW